jgi:hypothetical protein
VGFLLAVVALVFPLNLTGLAQSKQPDGYHGFSADATSLLDIDRKESLTVLSPDKMKSILVYREDNTNDFDFHVRVLAYGKKFWTNIGSHVDPEVMWAPDSKAFAETYSDGGAVGTFHVLVYFVGEGGLRIIEPTKATTRAYLSQPRACHYAEDPNVGAIAWIGDSDRLLVAAETLPHSNCDGMGTFRAYELRLPQGQIVKAYDQLEAKKRFWERMGEELRGADDECIRMPNSCEIPGLHAGTR